MPEPLATERDVESIVKQMMDERIPPLLETATWDGVIQGMVKAFNTAADLVRTESGNAGAELEAKLRWLAIEAAKGDGR